MPDLSSFPTESTPTLYDIGAFLRGGLNMSPETAAAMVAEMRNRMKTVPAEVDQDDWITVEFDIFVNLVTGFERLVAMWNDDVHYLVTDGSGSWSIEHSLRCRAEGNMAGCPIHLAVADWWEHGGADNFLASGRGEVSIPDHPTAKVQITNGFWRWTSDDVYALRTTPDLIFTLNSLVGPEGQVTNP